MIDIILSMITKARKDELLRRTLSINDKILSNGICDGLDKAKDIIASVAKNNGWMLVSEQLPSIPKEKIDEGFNRVAVLVTSKHEDMAVIRWYDVEEKLFYDDWDSLASVDRYVIAWRHLPETFKQ